MPPPSFSPREKVPMKAAPIPKNTPPKAAPISKNTPPKAQPSARREKIIEKIKQFIIALKGDTIWEIFY
jgi:Tfp pilus assembly protein FimV